MKVIKRRALISFVLAILMIFAIGLLCCLFGCLNNGMVEIGPIPNGTYYWDSHSYNGYTQYINTDDKTGILTDYYLKINGDSVSQYDSNDLYYKAKIVEREGKIYFEGYKWKDIFGEHGYTDIYEIEYDVDTKTITKHHNK